MPKLLLWGPALWARSAYGKNMLNLGLRLKAAGWEVEQFAFGGLKWNKVAYPPGLPPEKQIMVYPNGAADYGQEWLDRWYKFLQPDHILWHYDAWILGTSFKGSPLPITYYSPVDHDPCPPALAETLQGSKRVVSMSRFGQRVFQEAKIESTYIPHAIDHRLYCPGSREEARAAMQFPQEAFIVASVATNIGQRKNLPNLLRAFRNFLSLEPRARKDAYLYLHCNVSRYVDNNEGFELKQIWEGLDIAERIKYVHPIYYEAFGFTEEEMVNVYRAADWTCLVSLGEGFGVPLIESLACGTPVIFGNYSSMQEVAGPGGLPVGHVERFPFELSSSFQWIPSTRQITQCLVEAYRDWRERGSLRDGMAERGRQHVLRNYTYDLVMPQWLKYFEPTPALEELHIPAQTADYPHPRADVMVISWNGVEKRFLPQCVEALFQHTHVPFHLVIMDDQSTDGTEAYCRELCATHPNVTYYRPGVKSQGGSQAMNRAYSKCRTPYIVSMNNDIFVREGWLERSLECMEDSRVGVVGFKLLWPWDDKIAHAGGTFIKGEEPHHIGMGEPASAHSETRPALWVTGPCVLLRREVLEMGPGWDEEYDRWGGHEDVDICLRARKAGWKVLYCGAAEAYHMEGQTVTKMPSFWEDYERHRIIFSATWRGSKLLSNDSLEV